MNQILTHVVAFMWGLPLVILLVGGGLFFVFHSGFKPYLYLKHALDITLGKVDEDHQNQPSPTQVQGDVSHFQALMLALSGTLGLGNISGVAVAITLGGAGAIFWMWITALVGVATKFYTASLAVKYRGLDRNGHLQGGPMYVIREGLGKKWLPLAWLFCIGAMFGALPIFQINQLVQVLRDFIAIPHGLATKTEHFTFDLFAGLALFTLITAIVLGKLSRIAAVTSRLVPLMVGLYLLMTAYVLLTNAEHIPSSFLLIFTSAFNGNSVTGGLVGTIILIGVQRGAFSNEAGIGTESLAHGAAKTNEPIREGLVATLGPIVDTLIVCTCTALAILVTGVLDTELKGVSLTAQAFEQSIPVVGGYLLTLVVFFLSTSTVLTFWYYGGKCAHFLFGTTFEKFYVWFYLSLIIVGAVTSFSIVINVIDIMYATMAIPTMISTLLLAPKVKQAANKYFARLAVK
ncbi:MAG: alanine:cation symporter family protein [Alteromonadaceae bacterium]|nr:alanine:cation symporter family protein [Alteromonadaceae bacterium]